MLLKVYPVSHLGQHVRLQIERGKGQPWFEEANFSHPSVPPSCSVARCGPPLRDEIVVVDGSAALAPHRDELTRLLRGRRVLVAGKNLVHSLEDAPRFEGGRDNAPALVWACQQKPSAVLWIHGSQPICQPTVGLAGVRLLSLSVAAGPNRVLEEVPFEEVPRTGTLHEDLRGVLAQSQWKAARHPGLVEVERLLAAGDTAAARALACQKGLVTRVSSALVLESEAGNPYQPVTEPSGPPDDSAYPGKGFSFPGETVPEPCVGLLALLALPALRRRR